MITGPLCKAARALVGVSRYKLAANSGVDTRAIELFERSISVPDEAAVAALQSALEVLGAMFIPEEGSHGVGVRLKFNRSITKRIGTLENEGGPPAKDDVP
ncbi:XRE family transcriptional regulator [Mesorhizobium koreense]|jgi:transcriptional regulator with XRE-family HTH domain|uniref:XRE family transcriptional regulator n=1 Tax=Mesorhizobium koreense TaxID=3074855 RepID=UPI00287BB76A|nr:XRE family transcriptional regulator [Mesorhizobium sp. WR6]